MSLFLKRNASRARRKLARFQHADDGATAVEFAIVSLPFLTLLFGIIELAIVFFISSTVNHATSEAGRLIRVGRFQACGAQAEFKAVVCSKMGGLGNCWKNLRIDVITDEKFATLTVPPSPTPEKPEDGEDEPPPIEDGIYQDTNGGDNVIVRAVYNYRLALPEGMTRLGNPRGSGIRQMTALTAFRNEPFEGPSGCDDEVQASIDSGTPEETEDDG